MSPYSILLVLLPEAGGVGHPSLAVACREQVAHSQCGGAGLHDGGSGHDAGVVTALNGQLCVLFGKIVYCILLLVDAVGRLRFLWILFSGIQC